jgi:ribosomal protein L37AE/L43A
MVCTMLQRNNSNEEVNMHTKDNCDKCQRLVGEANLYKVPFLYLDKNDEHHRDMGRGYRQYYVCEECTKEGY